ncbi:MAG: ABC transporter permease [Bacillota bacterium]
MINPARLFAKRLFSELKFKFNMWRVVIDWTVALYIVIPALIVGIRQYLLLWQGPPDFLEMIPLSVLYFFCYFFAWSGSIRIFLREGDQLFLLNKEKWIKKIMTYGLVYSYGLNLFLTAFFFGLLAPIIFKHYHFILNQTIILFLITYLARNALGLTKQLISIRLTGWRRFLVTRATMIFAILFFILLVPYTVDSYIYATSTVVFLAASTVLLSIKRLNFKYSFFADVAREQVEKTKYVGFLLSISGINVKKAKKQKKTPWLFRHSNKIFKKRTPANSLVEVNLKSLLRNKERLLQFFQFFLICFLVILTIPGEAKWFIWIALAFVFTNFVGLYWRESLNSEFLQLFSWKPESQRMALKKFLFIIMLPSFLIIAFFGGLQSFSGLQAFMVLLPCGAAIYVICDIVTFYIMVTSKRKTKS